MGTEDVVPEWMLFGEEGDFEVGHVTILYRHLGHRREHSEAYPSWQGVVSVLQRGPGLESFGAATSYWTLEFALFVFHRHRLGASRC